jgi:hypothetical protein
MFKSENLSLTFSRKTLSNLPLPLREGIKGRGSKLFLSTLTLALPHRKGEGVYLEISNMFG